MQLRLSAIEGENVIEVRGEGNSDAHGMTISDLSLNPDLAPVNSLLSTDDSIQPSIATSNTELNLLQNGDFSEPLYTFDSYKLISRLSYWEISAA